MGNGDFEFASLPRYPACHTIQMPLIRPASADDLSAILEIYNHAVRHTTASYEYEVVTLESRQVWLAAKQAGNWPVFVAVSDAGADVGAVIGFSTYGPFRPQTGFLHSAEHSVYVSESARGGGVGRALLEPLIIHAKERGLHELLLETGTRQPEALRLYINAGFEFCDAFGEYAALASVGTIYSLGPTPRRDAWAVDATRGNLTSTELFTGAPAFVVGEGVVNMKALYGLDTNADRIVDRWTNVAPTTPALWAQVRSVRVAMLVRSRQFERTADQSASGVPTGVTLNVPTWSGDSLLPAVPNSAFVMTNADGSADSFGPNDPNPNNWRFYRYRVYEKEIPLRNVIWGMTP